MRDAIEALIDFDRVPAPGTDVEIFISATNVWSGEVEIFNSRSSRPTSWPPPATVFQAVEIDGVPYSDGGYMGNPALFPLIYESVTMTSCSWRCWSACSTPDGAAKSMID